MERIKIDSSNHFLYRAFINLYSISFPVFEQRRETQQEYAFSNDNYHLIGYSEEGIFIGFISYWEFSDYIYIEHFAINTDVRGNGYGSALLSSFINSTDKIILLEIDPIIDDISKARMRFYKRCGFYDNSHAHKHPSYRTEYQPHYLIVLTTKRQITEEEYKNFYADLSMIVMNNNI